MVISSLSSDNRRFLEIEVGNALRLKFYHVRDVQVSFFEREFKVFCARVAVEKVECGGFDCVFGSGWLVVMIGFLYVFVRLLKCFS